MPSTWMIWRWRMPGTHTATLARLGHTSVQVSHTVAQPRQRLSSQEAQSVHTSPRLARGF